MRQKPQKITTRNSADLFGEEIAVLWHDVLDKGLPQRLLDLGVRVLGRLAAELRADVHDLN